MKPAPFILSIVVGLFLKTAVHAQPYDFQNTRLKDDRRVELFLQHLTLDEKKMWLSPMLGTARLGMPVTSCYEGLHGLALGGPSRHNGVITVDGKEVPNDLPTTIFPQAYGMGCTWDRSLIRRIGEIEAEEVRWYAQGNIARRKGLVVFAPNADLARDPRWGRTEESYGEDPYLVGQLAVAMVKGLQGDDPRYWKTCALMKHFLANSNEDGRDSTSSNFDERLFREYYAYPFFKGITEGGSRAFMASYNCWNGIPMCVHPCLNEITRREWGNNGIICTDGGAFTLLVNAHHYYPDFPTAAAAVIKAGTSQFLDRFQPYLNEAIERGLVTEADIDRVIRGNIFVALKLGLLDDKCPYADIGKDSTAMPPYEREEVKQFVREVTAKSIVLLKNAPIAPLASPEGETLPLLPLTLDKLQALHRAKANEAPSEPVGRPTIAVVGPYADKIVYDWYSGTAPYENTILKAMQEAGGEQGIEILYAPDNQYGRAEDLARQADMVLLCTGNHPYGTDRTWKVCPVPSDGREANDRHSLQLPDEDEIRRIYSINPNTVLVLVSSFPYAINWSNDHLPAIIHVTHCSQEQGHGVADVLFGRVNPAGRTNQTWVRDVLDLPHIMDYDIRHGRTYMYFEGQPLYPFGYGLSYTRFEYGQARILRQDRQKVYVAVPVRNAGSRDGDEVVQLYASYPQSQVEHPRRQLRAFERVTIPAGETLEVILEVDKSDLTYWSTEAQAFLFETGTIHCGIGAITG